MDEGGSGVVCPRPCSIEAVSTERVTFPHGDITMVGHLFTPEKLKPGQRYPVIVVTHPFGAVKEQGGEPHFTESPRLESRTSVARLTSSVAT